MIDNLQLNKNLFSKNRFLIIDNFLNYDFALDCQKEVINSNKDNFDRYENPFEQKYTWRDKKIYLLIVANYLVYLILKIL
tara:strand:- start:1126 stop:1365 length:240 start_codon:yes stop_codon:yes gene_type:complete